jgi:hypothetical protein
MVMVSVIRVLHVPSFVELMSGIVLASALKIS